MPKLEYWVIENGNRNRFLQEVAEAIELGWVPQGGVSCYSMMYLQAMVRKSDEQPS